MFDGGQNWFGTNTGIVVVTVAMLPIAALTVWALARRRRRRGATPGWAWRASLAEVGIVYGTVPWLVMTTFAGQSCCRLRSAEPGAAA